MPHYALFYELVDGFTEKRTPHRAVHLEHVRAAHDRGELVMAGPLTEPVDTAMLVFRGESAQGAERFAQTDPYVNNGLVKSWRVRPWLTVVGDGATLPATP